MFQHKEIATAGQDNYESKVYLKNMREWLMRKLSYVGPRDHGPFGIKLKSCLMFSASCLSDFTTQEFWSTSLLMLLKFIPLWSKCWRNIWCLYSAHKVKHIPRDWAKKWEDLWNISALNITCSCLCVWIYMRGVFLCARAHLLWLSILIWICQNCSVSLFYVVYENLKVVLLSHQ